MDIPPPPASAPRATARVHLRFEDVTQDGRLVLEALPNALGATVWSRLLHTDPSARAMYAHGVIPILSRFVLDGAPGPFAATVPVEADGAYRLARDDAGRIVLDMWADLHGPIGRTYGTVDRAGERAPAGRVYAEHVLTRPFAPSGDRRVTSLDFPGAPAVNETRATAPAYETISRPPAGADLLDAAVRPDPVLLTFGLMHTDSNRHVNSLVYLRLFEEAALRRFAELGLRCDILATGMDIAYRKPCFAGQSVRVLVQAFRHDGRLGVAATLVPEEPAKEDGGKAHAYVRMAFDSGSEPASRSGAPRA